MPFCEAVFQINEHARRHIILVARCTPFLNNMLPTLHARNHAGTCSNHNDNALLPCFHSNIVFLNNKFNIFHWKISEFRVFLTWGIRILSYDWKVETGTILNILRISNFLSVKNRIR